MKRKIAFLILLFVLVSVSIQVVPAQPPTSTTIFLAGNMPGQPDGDVALRFRLFPVSAGGMFVFEETQTVTVTAETFVAFIGNGTMGGLPWAIFRDNPSLWIAFALEATPDMEVGARTPITGNGYAFKAATADNAGSVGGVPASGFIQTTGGGMSGNSASQILSVANAGSGAGLTASSISGRGITATSASSTGVYGASNGGGATAGVWGVGTASNGNGVVGEANTGTNAYGVWGRSTSGIGVRGDGSTGVSGAGTGTNGVGVSGSAPASGVGVRGEGGDGVRGISATANGNGVVGEANNGTNAYGVWGRSTSGIGVQGSALYSGGIGVKGTGSTGVSGESYLPNGTGVKGVAAAVSGNGEGVYGTSAATNGAGVRGVATTSSGENYGVYGVSTSPRGTGVYGLASASVETAGVKGVSAIGTGVIGDSAQGTGVWGISRGGPNGRGVLGDCNGDGCIGVRGTAIGTVGSLKKGVVGTCFNTGSDCFAGYFEGRVAVAGTLTKTAGSFKIDHPLDPENKYLYHSFVESPDMMNIYNGNVVLDGRGEAWVPLPDWFEALNRDFRYQLTCLGGFAPVYVAQKISGHRFRIAGGHPGLEVSWQVTGIRRDPFAEKHRIPVEEDKPAQEKGYYLHPDAYGQPQTKSVEWGRNPETMQRMVAAEREAAPKPEP